MPSLDYSRVYPRSRTGTTGVSVEKNLHEGEGAWINPPDRIAAITIAVHVPAGETAEFAIECSCNHVETIGIQGTGGYWDPIEPLKATYTKSVVLMLTNAVTGIRVRCISASSTINVCFVG